MKIFQISASYKPAYIYGGPTMSVSKLCEELVKAGTLTALSVTSTLTPTPEDEQALSPVTVEVLTSTANGLQELNVEPGKTTYVDGVPVTYFKRLTKDHTHFSPALYWGLWKKLKQPKIYKKKIRERDCFMPRSDGTPAKPIVHIHAWWNLVSIFSCLIAKWKNTPVILSPRGTLSGYSFGNRNAGVKDNIHRFLGKTLLEYCHFHVTSEKEKGDILHLVEHPKSITIIPNFVKIPRVRNEQVPSISYESEEQPLRLLFLSRIEEKKGLDLLFDALSELQISWILTVAGSGDESYVETLKSKSKSSGLEPRIHWIGQVDQDEKWDILKNHDLLILPSYDENFANVVIESLAMGTAVLVSNRVGLSDYVKENDFGWVSSVNVQNIRETLLDVNKNREKLQEIRKAAPSKIKSDFEEKALTSKYLQLYNSVNNYAQ
ncbi:glycosyltransferase [Pedobacter sp. HMF7647]|uniref:Glycosyltransferase n=1 Tax=Hufsiella arboris TaxID=2695275 RepID=A0A7K1YDY5_9SPHI|nr:glycosyltransferase [Hufsiella arboris]MXV52813.1 glycosyltransferase [Hufsiella arboris]